MTLTVPRIINKASRPATHALARWSICSHRLNDSAPEVEPAAAAEAPQDTLSSTRIDAAEEKKAQK